MTQAHFTAFQQAAQEAQVMAVVRNTNTVSTRLIENGCPGKPLTIKFHTSETTGVVTAGTPAEIATARQLGYYVVDADHIARREVTVNGKTMRQELRLGNAFWKLEAGQVIDPKLHKPLVGDYDLMGVIEPQSPGRNIALVSSGGNRLNDVSSPVVKGFADRVNAKLDRPRVLHGAQDQFAGFRGGATVFLPDGRSFSLPDEHAVKEFYELIGRQTMTGSYRLRPPSTIPVISGRGLIQNSRVQGVLKNQAAMAALGQMLGVSIQMVGDWAVQRRIQSELETTHAGEIIGHLSRGNGVLVIIRMQEWAIPDFNGMRARGLLGVYVEGGATQREAIESWQKPKIIQEAPLGWRSFERYAWIDPH